MHNKALVILRPVSENDVDLLYFWANDPVVREASFSRDKIDYDAHREWFARRLNSPDCMMFVGLTEKTPFGVVRFERKDQNAFVSISVAREFRGWGFSTALLEKGIDLVRKEKFALAAYAEIKDENTGSILLFEKSGFQRVLMPPREGSDEKARVYQLKL